MAQAVRDRDKSGLRVPALVVYRRPRGEIRVRFESAWVSISEHGPQRPVGDVDMALEDCLRLLVSAAVMALDESLD
jgi:hypothetical protein